MKRFGRWWFEWNWSSVNVPRVRCWRDGDRWGIGLTWGNRRSDPVWRIDYEGGRR